MGETEVAPIFKFGPKLNVRVPVQYVDGKMASSYGLTCL